MNSGGNKIWKKKMGKKGLLWSSQNLQELTKLTLTEVLNVAFPLYLDPIGD